MLQKDENIEPISHVFCTMLIRKMDQKTRRQHNKNDTETDRNLNTNCVTQMKNHRNQNHKTTPKSFENIVPDENHTFGQHGATSRKEDIKKHKNDGKRTHKSSTNGITKRRQKLMPPKSQK